MTKRVANFRQGDLAEGLGILLLRQLAFVAEVPREEDVGIDAFCTLAYRDGKFLYAGESFAVQIKSSSVEELELNEERTEWFQRLDVPLFWLSVDLKQTRAKLYTLVHASASGVNPTHLTLTVPKGYSQEESQWWTVFPTKSASQVTTKRYVGPPILEFSLEEIQQESARQGARECLKAHVKAFNSAIELRRVGGNLSYRWEANAAPTGHTVSSVTTDETIGPLWRKLYPLLVAAGGIVFHKKLRKQPLPDRIVSALTELQEYAKSHLDATQP